MHIREYSLPAGWYPRNPSDISGEISRYLKGFSHPAFSRAAISPHAGWFYSGRIASIGVSALDRNAQTVAVIGGHLAAGSPALFAMEDAVRTPFGPMPINTDLRAALTKELNGAQDKYRDNTVEVLLPMVRHFFPNASLLWLRLPEDKNSFEAGKIISRVAASLKCRINVLGSTDLTHYGANYGFSPKGSGKAALRWVQEVNDAAFIRAVEDGDSDKVLLCANKDSSSCSAGAVLGAMGFAEAEGLGRARLLEYGTSADMQANDGVPDSFVGYAAFTFGAE